MTYDAVIVGGGAAGLSAGLVLARGRRNIVIVDDGQPRNGVVDYSHGFFTRDGERPGRLIDYGRRDLASYPTVQFVADSVTGAEKSDGGFVVTVASGTTLTGKTLLLATGVYDALPSVPGLPERWGKSVYVCPFCDGWEIQDQRVAVYGKGRDTVELAQELYGWTNDLIVCLEHDDTTRDDQRWIEAAGVDWLVGKLESMSGTPAASILTFADGSERSCTALFLSAPLRQHSPLFASLGCKTGEDGRIVIDAHGKTTVDGCYAAGDAVTLRHQVVIAAASGAAAAITINCNLLEAEARALAATVE